MKDVEKRMQALEQENEALRKELAAASMRLEGAYDMSPRPPLPPFTEETAVQKVRLAEDGWNTRDPERSPLPIPSIHVGETAPSSSTGESRSLPSSAEVDTENSTTG